MRAKEIDRLVSKIMKVKLSSLHEKNGKRSISEARYIAMYLRKKYLKQSLNAMAKEWGYSNHTVTRAGVLNVENHLQTEKDLREKLRNIEIVLEHRLDIISRNKRKYNDHFLLKQKGINVDAKQKIISANEFTFITMCRQEKKILSRLTGLGYALQLQLYI